MNRRCVASFLLATIVLFGLLPQAAYAYVDPNTGGLLFQLFAPILLLFAAAWAFLRHHTRRIASKLIEAVKSLFTRRS